MPKPLFTRLAAICAVGLFCVLFGGVYALSQKDTILLVMSLLLGVCCIIRFLLLYHTIKTEDYLILEGTCVKREKSPLTRNQQVLFRTTDGKEYRFSLEKNTPKEKKELSDEEKEYKSMRKKIQEKHFTIRR